MQKSNIEIIKYIDGSVAYRTILLEFDIYIRAKVKVNIKKVLV